MKKLLLLFLLAIVSVSLLAQRSENEQLAIQYYQNGEYEKAADLFEDLFDKKQDSYIYYYYYQTLMALNDYKKLEKVVKKQKNARLNTVFSLFTVLFSHFYLPLHPQKQKTSLEGCQSDRLGRTRNPVNGSSVPGV